MLKKNETYVMEVTGYSESGDGIGRIDDIVVFVPNAILGETIKVLIVKVLKSFAYGKAVEIIRPSADRVSEKCPYSSQCGGCSLWHMTYEAELKFKQMKVSDAMKRIGGTDTKVQSTVPSPLETQYRNKAQYPVSSNGIGFYAPRSHRVIPIDSCMIQNSIDKSIISAVNDYMVSCTVPAYNEESHGGIIRSVFIRTAYHTQKTLVCIVTRTKELPHSDVLTDKLKQIEGVASIIQNINPDRTNVVLGKKNITLWGSDRITEQLNGLTFTISPHSFFQINTLQTEQLYKKAIELAALTGKETVYDLYCGTGTISLSLARHAKKVIGVECVPQAVADARDNAAVNNIDNAQFYLGTAEDVVPQLYREHPADVVVLDPPRKGCDSTLLNTILRMAPDRIVYISCNPATLARDIKLLKGYHTTEIMPFDMFPKTPHVECCVLLRRT